MNIKTQILLDLLTPKQMLVLEEKLKNQVSISLQKYLNEYFERMSITAKQSYLKRSIRPTINKLIDEFGIDKSVDRINKNDAEKFILSIYKKSPHNALLILRVCKAIWNWGIRRDHLEVNVFSHIKLPTPQRQDPVMIPDSDFESISTFIPNHLKDFYIVYKYTGLRASELLSLKKEDINIEQKTITVGSKNFITKSRKSRIVPMNDVVFKIIESRVQNQKKDRIIFAKTYGAPYPVDYISRIFKRACRDAGMLESYHLHCLRKTFGSNLVSKGVHLSVVSRLLGHSNSRITEEYYLGFQKKDLQQAVNQL